MQPNLESDALYENEKFDRTSCENASINGSQFYKCTFDRINFQYSELKKCSFEDCIFNNCNCSLMKINTVRFTNARFTNCKLIGINWSFVHKMFTASFVNSNLNTSVFSDINLAKFVFDSCSLDDAVFSRAVLTNTVFNDCSLKGCSFSHSDLTNADFSTSYDYFVSSETNKLRKTVFSLPEATSLLKNFDIILK